MLFTRSMLTQNYLILAECNLLRAHHPTGVFVMPSTEDPLVWCGIISVRSGYYTGGIFNVQLYLPEDFPSNTLPVSVDGWDDASFIARARQKLKATVDQPEPTDSRVLGYSWLDPDTMAIFSKEGEMPKSTDA
ncbi:unnamed protein product [Dicrocoelium dendriticum]|nr:unnamed protein product [Dicrocoelium dendriticum]